MIVNLAQKVGEVSLNRHTEERHNSTTGDNMKGLTNRKMSLCVQSRVIIL